MNQQISVLPNRGESWDQILNLLPKGWAEQCKTQGAAKWFREFKDPQTLLRTLLMHVMDGASLMDTVAYAREAGMVDVSDVALLKRLNHAGNWFQWMTQELIREWSLRSEVAQPLPLEIRLVDATHVKEPGPRGAQWRIHYALDMRTLAATQVVVSDQGQGETFKNFSIEANALYIGDRGYYHFQGIKHVIDRGAQVLVRMSSDDKVLFTPESRRFKILEHLRGLTGSRIGDWPVTFEIDGRRISGRVCAIRKSAVAAQRAIEEVYQTYGRKQKKLSKRAIEAAKYVFVFTTLSREQLSAAAALDLFRGRWQIELVFKRLKSIIGLGHLHKQDPEGAKAWLNGKIFSATLIDAFTKAAEYFSPWGYPLAA